MKTLFTRTLILISFLLLLSNNAFSQVPQIEKDALIALYNATDGPNWSNSTNWNTAATVDTWHGVTVVNNRVTELDLFNNSLNGTIPTEIGDLTNMQSLNLRSNQLTGGIPLELWSLTNLTLLNLGFNQLSGTIPSEIGNLTNLTFIYLGFNQITGSIPAEIGNLANLEELFLGALQLSGSIPSSIWNMTNLIYLYLNGNQLTGSIPPEIDNLTNLVEINLSQNQLSGTIPTEIGNMTNLTKISLRNLQLSGSIPSELGNLTNLSTLWLYNNQLTGTIPSEFWDLTNLTSLSIYNNQFTGAIPAEIGNLSNLTRLFLSDNQFTGTIPSEIGNLAELADFRIFNNQFNGPLPTEIGNLTNLTHLWLYNNQFTDLPDLSALTALSNLQMQNNQFTFDDIEPNLDVATFLYVPQGLVTAPEEISLFVGQAWEISIPVGGSANEYQWFKDGIAIDGETADNLIIESASAEDIGFYSLRITNTLVTDLTLWTNDIHITLNSLILGVQEEEYEAILEFYDATDGDNWEDNTNWGSDELVEDWYGVIVENEHIIGLILEANQLSGELPPEIGVLDSLENLDLSNNQLEGPLPFELGDLSILQNLILDSNLISGSIPESFGNLSLLETLLLNSNQLDGIPDLFGIDDIPFLNGLDNLTDFQIQNNKLEFDDLEPNVEITGIVYAPQALITGPEPITLTEGEELNITIPVGGLANEYQWVKDNEDIDGANTDNLVIGNVSAADIGTYYLRITNPVVPELTLYSDDIIVDIITGIRHETINSAFKIYPIPVTAYLNIETKNLPEGEYDLRIVDLTGKTMINELPIAIGITINNSVQEHKVDVNALPAGIYMVMLQYADGVFVQKVVKE